MMRGKLLLGGLALLAATAAALGFFWPFRNRAETLRLPGVVEVQEVRLSSKIGGRVEDVHVLEGARVEPRQPVVTFEVPELKAQREQALARVQLAEAELKKAQEGPRPEEKEAAGAAVAWAKAQLDRLQESSPKEIQQARKDLDTALTDLKLAREDFEREERLYRSGSGTRAAFDAARAARDRAQGRADAAQARLDVLEVSRPREIEAAAADLKRAEANHKLLLAGTRSEDLAAAEARAAEARGRLRELDINLEEAVVRAPERAFVEVVAVRKGDVVPPNQAVVRVLRADDLWVKVYVPETQLGKVRHGQAVEVTVDGYPDRRFKGQIFHIANESEFTPRNVQSADERKHQVFGVKVRVADPQGVFKSGMAAEVTIPMSDE
jgi:multidrug resistance efflux pump